MKSREYKKIYHPKLGRFVYEHRGNGLIIDNIMKPLKAGLSTAVNKGTRAVVRKFSKKAKSATATAKEQAKAKAKSMLGDSTKQEKSGDLIRKRLSKIGTPRGRQSTSRGRSRASNASLRGAKMSQNEART